ncbi:MAG: histidine phosphatase family protein, partial [Armatimonadota bacterium]|nr:histidine phosphatase family protein [Armatimonadota bacterium]
MGVQTVEAIQTRLLLLCRGPVDWTQASDGDPPLAAAGALDAELTAGALPHFDVIVASPQRASQETAEAIAAQRRVAMDLRDGLDEIRSATTVSDAAGYIGWLDDLFTAHAPLGAGESLADGADRLTAALRAIGDRYYGRATLV